MAYKCYNIRLHKIIESENVTVDDTKPIRIQIQRSVDDEEIDDEKVDDKRNKESTQKEDIMKKKKKEYRKKEST